MILTYKVKHGLDFTDELAKAKKVADFAVEHKTLSSKDVKHIGLKSVISNQILRKYARNKKVKQVKSVNLTIPNQGIKVNQIDRTIQISSLKLSFEYQFPNNFDKVNQIEINNEYIFISVTMPDKEQIDTDDWIGVDLNTTGHIAVVANPETGKVIKLGKSAEHIHKKYKEIRKDLQKSGSYKIVKRIKNRENRIVRDLNHQISRKIIDTAVTSGCGIKVEDLKGIRKTAKSSRTFRYSLNSWSFYQLQQMIEYKAKLQGIPVVYVDPYHTSKSCSRCGLIGNRRGKEFECQNCGHVDHADANAAFNIASRQGIDRSIADRDVVEGSTDTPKEATVRTLQTSEPQPFRVGRMSEHADACIPSVYSDCFDYRNIMVS